MKIVISSKQDNNMKIHIINDGGVEVFLVDENEEVNCTIEAINNGIDVESNLERLEAICKPEIGKNKERLKQIERELNNNINIHSLESSVILKEKLGDKWNVIFTPEKNKVKVSYKKSNVYLPDLLIQEMLDNEDISRYKKFWRRCLENKIPYITQQLFNWIKTNGVKINKHGLLIGFRGAIEVTQVFDMIKSYGKSFKNKILVYFHSYDFNEKNAFKIIKDKNLCNSGNLTVISKGKEIENIMYNGLYTHWFSTSNASRLFFTLGKEYKEAKIDINPSNECSNGLICSPFN